jgi:hypothetical protein
MELDYKRMLDDPGNPYPAFDFFVAADHITDWRYPSSSEADKKGRAGVRAHDPGKTISHLANGAKHFRATADRHKSVAGVESEADYGTAVLGRARLDEMVLDTTGRPALVITMTDGRRVEAIQLAALALAYWRKELGPGGLHRLPEED